jgi:hypothetical protein
MLFTTQTPPKNTTVSLLFKDKGDTRGYPTAVSDSETIGIKTQINPTFTTFKSFLGQTVAARVQGVVSKPKNTSDFLGLDIRVNIARPTVGISFRY